MAGTDREDLEGVTETPENVAREATEIDVLPLDRIALVGIFGKAGDWGALIRRPTGGIVNAKLGDRTPVGRIIAIDDSRVVLRTMGSTLTLRMPDDRQRGRRTTIR